MFFRSKIKTFQTINFQFILIRFFVGFYCLFAVAKLWTVTQPHSASTFLDHSDLLFPIFSLRQLLLIGALMELGIGGIFFLNKNIRFSWCCVASFSSALLCYRVVNLYYLGLTPCSCLGILTYWLRISMHTESILTLIYLLIVVPLSWFYVLKGDTNSFKEQPGS